MTILDRSDDGLVLESLPDGTYAWLRPAEAPIEIKEATPADLLATPARFSAWLNAQPDDVTVGLPQMSDMCPLATFLGAEGFLSVSVCENDVMWGWDARPVHTVPLPDWASHFIGLVDLHNHTWPVRASQARARLQQIEAER